MNFKRVDEILLDEGFYAWFLHTDEQLVKRWNEWRLSAEVNRKLLEEAVKVLKDLIEARDEEGFPKKIHAVQIRIDRALAKAKNQTVSIAVLPSNKAALPEDVLYDICLS